MTRRSPTTPADAAAAKRGGDAPAGGDAVAAAAPRLRARRLGIDTLQERIVYLRGDGPVTRSEGFDALTRVRVSAGSTSVLATINVVVDGARLGLDEVGLSESAWSDLGVADGDLVLLRHAEPIDSFTHVRGKLYGNRLEPDALRAVVGDIAGGRYTDVQISAFVAACSGTALDRQETLSLTSAMLDAGERMSWGRDVVVDKHSVGGLPGNRTTPIVVSIATALGLTMPKTSSRAITSPAGTADVVETMTSVDLDATAMRRVVETEGGCVVWGRRVRLSPADDVLIRVERALDMDSEAQLVASVLSKKLAAGSTHVVIDAPVGPGAKLRTPAEAASMRSLLEWVGERLGLHVRVVPSDGSQPVGRGIGPALEAWDVLAVLRGEPDAPRDLRERALALAAAVLELGGHSPAGKGLVAATQALESGAAWRKWLAICEAQGGFSEPPRSPRREVVPAPARGTVAAIDNRLIARVAKLAGAPADPSAGVLLATRRGAYVREGDPLFEVHAEHAGVLAYALAYLRSGPPPVRVEPE